MTVTTLNPATGGALKDYEETSYPEIEAILAQAGAAASIWRHIAPAERSDTLRRLASALRASREELAYLATQEMGKPLRESVAEIDKCALTCDWFAEHGPALLTPEPVRTEAVDTRIVFEPLGVLFAIMPWNYPFWQVVRALAPAIVSGNVFVLKHAPSTTGCALRLAEIVAEAGFPDGVFSVVVAGPEQTPEVCKRIIADDRVAAVTLTGSTGAGRAVAAIAGRHLKKAVLELGGSDPFIVLADADVAAAARWAARSRFQNAGQSCIATKRIIAVESVADAFADGFLAEVARLVMGDPTAEGTTVGPLAREDLRDGLAGQVQRSVDQGARVLAGGRVPDQAGFFYPPTVLDHVTSDMPVVAEETFGPAVPLIRARDADDAVRIANATPFGLGSNIWTADLDRGATLATALNAGHTAINGMTASDPRLPFGGVKHSGYGRELSHYGVQEFVNVHVIVTNASSGPVEVGK